MFFRATAVAAVASSVAAVVTVAAASLATHRMIFLGTGADRPSLLFFRGSGWEIILREELRQN